MDIFQNKNKEINNRLIRDGITRDIRTLFEQEKEEDYCKPKRVTNFWNNSYIEYESNGHKKRNLSLGKYLNKIESFLRNTIIDLQSSDTLKIQLMIAIIFISSKDVEEEFVMHSRSGDIKFASYNDLNEVVNELLSFHSKYQGNLKTSMRESDFIFNTI